MSVPQESLHANAGPIFPGRSQDPTAPMGAPMVPMGSQVESALAHDIDIDTTAPELVNLALYMKPEELDKVGEECLEDFKDDEVSRESWMDMHAFWVKLYYQKDQPLNPPWQGSSAESIPILAEGCNQFHSRAYKAFFGRPGFIKAAPTGKIDKAAQERAERVGHYMSWQLEVKDTSYKRNKDRLLRALPLHGSFFTKVYRDPVRHRNVIENVRAIDLVVPYGSQATNIEEMERKTQIIMMSLRTAATYVASKYFAVMPEEFSASAPSVVQKALDDALGIRENPSAKVKPAKIIEQHRWLDLNKDGVPEPYIVWVDCQSRKVLRISIRYDVDELGAPLENQDPLEFFTHYTYIENPDGFYALGLGHLTGDLNSSVNKMLRQAIDAGTLQNLGTMFASRNCNLPKGQVELEYGKINIVDGMIDDIRKSLLSIPFPGPSPALIDLMQQLIDRADRLNMVTDALTGQSDKVFQPTTVMAQIEQGLTLFTSVQVRVYSALEEELKKLYRLNKLYAQEVEYFAINDALGQSPGFIVKEDFSDDLQIRPAIDISSATETGKAERAKMVYGWAMENPIVMNSPPHLYEASKRFLEAIGETDIDSILPKPEEIAAQQEQQAAQQQEMMEAEMMVKDKELDLQQQDVDIKRMSAQAEIATNQFKQQLTAVSNEEKSAVARHSAAARTDQADEEIKVQREQIVAENERAKLKARVAQAKTAADFETQVRKLKETKSK